MKRKLKGIKFKRVDGIINDGPLIKCKDGSSSYSVMGCENKGGVAESSIDDYGYTPEPRLPEPEPTSQMDCSQGLVFAPSYTETLSIKCQVPPCGTREVRIPARCKYPESQNDCPSGTKYVAGKSYVGCPPGWPKELGCHASRQSEPGICVDTPTNECPEGYDLVISQEPPDFCQQYYSQGKPCPRIMPSRKCVKKDVSGTVQENVQNSLQSLMDKNWLLPAIAIGVGVYLITRKSQKMQEYKGFTLAGPERTLEGQFLIPVMDDDGTVVAEGTGETLEDATEDAKAKIDAIDY